MAMTTTAAPPVNLNYNDRKVWRDVGRVDGCNGCDLYQWECNQHGFVKKGVKDKTALDKLYDKRRNQEANQNDNEVDELDDDGDDGDLGDDDDGLLDDILAYEQEGQGSGS